MDSLGRHDSFTEMRQEGAKCGARAAHLALRAFGLQYPTEIIDAVEIIEACVEVEADALARVPGMGKASAEAWKRAALSACYAELVAYDDLAQCTQQTVH
jgi:hypothetical protein